MIDALMRITLDTHWPVFSLFDLGERKVIRLIAPDGTSD
jgi:hypothetical protein